MHLYMPWWLYKQQKAGQDAVCARLPHRNRRRARSAGRRVLGGYAKRWLGGGYGVELKQNLRKIYGCEVHFSGRGEMIPNEDSYCEIDPERRRSVGHSRPSLPLQMEPG